MSRKYVIHLWSSSSSRTACGQPLHSVPNATDGRVVTCKACRRIGRLDPPPAPPKKLIAAIERLRVGYIEDDGGGAFSDKEFADTGELLAVLQRILRGQEPLEAFGAPGDWGYETAIGQGLISALRGEG